MDWMTNVLKAYIKAHQLRTTYKNILAACDYAITQGYDASIGLFCDALLADSKMLEILLPKEKKNNVIL